MKKLMSLIVVMLSAAMLFAQSDTVTEKTLKGKFKEKMKDDTEMKTIFGSAKAHGGYLGINMGYSQVNNNDAIVAGGRLAWVINHSLALGFGGSGFANDVYLEDYVPSQSTTLNGGYGYMLIEPIIGAKLPVHVSFPIFVGIGGVARTTTYKYDDFSYDYDVEETDVFTVLEPGVELELSMLKFLRLSIGASYRSTFGMHLYNVSDDALNDLSYNFTLKFGKF